MKNMRIALRALVGIAGLSALCAVTSAGAVPITDFVNPTDTLTMSDSTPSPCPAGFACVPGALTYLHDITDNGFVIGLDIITSATIAIHLTDQFVTGPNNETYRYDIGTVPQTSTCGAGNCVPNGGVTDTITLDSSALADLVADGKISVTVSSSSGNLLFADSLLTVVTEQVTEFVPRISNVPEPSTLLLLVAGLAGLGSRFQRRS